MRSPGRAIARLIPLLALGALLASCQDADPPLAPKISGPQFSHTPGPLAGTIAFHSTRDGDFEIFVMNADGSGVTQVTNTGSNVDPIWSPDGRRMAFAGFRSGRSEIFVINVDGTGETQLTTEGGFPGAWSPEGTRIAFASNRDGDDEVFVMNADGTGVTQLTSNGVADSPTAWSPDGGQIAFISDRDGDLEIYVMNADGSGVTQLTDDPAVDFGDRAGWSPDGTRFVFSSTRDGGDIDIFVMNPDGTGVTQLTQNDFVADDDPVWSPDGEHIAFHSTRDGDEEIFIMNADGTGTTQLTFNEGVFDAVPVWIQQVSPSNDDFANATVVSAFPFTDAVDITGATAEAGEPGVCFGPSHTVWYSITPPVKTAIQADLRGSSFSDAAFHIWRSFAPGLGGLGSPICVGPGGSQAFTAEAGTTYYIQAGSIFSVGGTLRLNLQQIPPPPNDAFSNATAIAALPFTDAVTVIAATEEPGEPVPTCRGSINGSVWYAFTPEVSGSISARFVGFFPSSSVAAYTGGSLGSLSEVGCRGGEPLTFRAHAGTTYYFQASGVFDGILSGTFTLEVAPPPVANFFFFPGDASIFDVVQFVDQSFDPGGVSFASHAWSFGDGTTGTGGGPTHRYAADGDYTVQLTVTTLDGRTAPTSQTVLVRTHDVAITKLAVPQTGRSGQTRRLTVSINSKRYPETVEVQLLKSVPGGFQQFGSLTQSVPMNSKNGTTNFNFSYTFTAADAQIGKVTFKAVAFISGARDVLPADNEAIAPPTKVSR